MGLRFRVEVITVMSRANSVRSPSHDMHIYTYRGCIEIDIDV